MLLFEAGRLHMPAPRGRRTALAKGELGIRERKALPTLKEFAGRDFLPFVASTFSAKLKNNITNPVLRVSSHSESSPMPAWTPSPRRQLLPSLLPANLLDSKSAASTENFRHSGASSIWQSGEEWRMYFAAAKSERMEQHLDPRLLHDVASILLDCGLRPEECFRLRPENVRDGRLRFNIGEMGILRRALSVLQFWANNYRLNPAIQRLLFPNWLAA
jgi:hypothetical protein